MKSQALLAILLISMGSGAFAESGRSKFYLGLEVYTVADSADNWKKNSNDLISGLVDVVGYDTAGYKMETTPGIGGKIGVAVPFRNAENADWGASLGYIKGPANDNDVHAESISTTPGLANEKIETSFVRMLLEIKKTFPLGSGSKDSQARFSIGAGVGAAYGSIKSTTKASGSFVTVLGYPSTQTDNKTWIGPTWEIYPSLIIPSGTTEIELGVKISGFPKLKESTNFSEFNWNPLSIFGALHF